MAPMCDATPLRYFWRSPQERSSPSYYTYMQVTSILKRVPPFGSVKIRNSHVIIQFHPYIFRHFEYLVCRVPYHGYKYH